MHSRWRFSEGHELYSGDSHRNAKCTAYEGFQWDMCHHLEKCKLCRHFLLFPDFALIDYHLDKVQTPQAFYDTHQPPWFHISYSAGPCSFVGYILTICYIQAKFGTILNPKGWKHSAKNHSTDDDDIIMMTRAKWIGVTNGCLTTSFRFCHDFLCICTS